jgi:hypothetical protein
MRWDDEPYVRLYKRETPEWSVLSWQARALFHELLKRVDMAGLLMVGRSGVRGLAGLVRMPIDVVEAAMHGDDGLLADGCVVEVDGGYLLPNFVEAQQARQSDRARKAEQRARDRATKLATGKGHTESHAVTNGHTESEPVTASDNLGQSVTNRDHESQNVTDCHTRSHDVTRGHSEQSRAEQSRSENTPSECVSAREAPAPRTHTAAPSLSTEDLASVIAEHPRISMLARDESYLGHIIGGAIARGHRAEWLAVAVADAAADLPMGSTEQAIRAKVRSYCSRARAPQVEAAAEPAPLQKLPPGTGKLPPVLTAPPRRVEPPTPADNPVLRALGASPRQNAPSGQPGAPTAIGDLLAGLVRPEGAS